jgi:type I restriction enzyme, S subunit
VNEPTDHWGKAALGSIADVRLGRTPKKDSYLDSGANKIVKYRDVVGETVKWTNEQRGFVPEDLLPNLVDLREGDVLIGASAHSAEHVGRKVAIVGPKPSCFKSTFVSGELLRLRSKDFVLPRWLLYFFSSSEGYRAVQAAKRGIHLLGGQARQIEIPVAPLPEQRQIIEAIEFRFSRLDAAVRGLHRVQASLDRYRASLLNLHFPEEGTSPVPATHVELSAVCSTATGGTPRRGISDYYGGTIPWVKSGELNDARVLGSEERITQAALDNSNAKVFPAGTVCMALYGATVGRLGILGVSAATNQAICAFFPKEQLSPRYLFWFLRSTRSRLLRQRSGGTQPNISQTLVRKLRVPLPSLDEQSEIAAEIERRLSVTEEVAAEVSHGVELCFRLRESILKMAFEGCLVRQDPRQERPNFILERSGPESVASRPAPNQRRVAPAA